MAAVAGPHVLLIPGTNTMHHLEENLSSARVTLTESDLAELADISIAARPVGRTEASTAARPRCSFPA